MFFNGFCLLFIALFGSVTLLCGQIRLSLHDKAVGMNLQASASVILSEPAEGDGFNITVHSSDEHLQLSRSPLQQGSQFLVLHVKGGFRQSPEFWLQARASEGAATITAEASGCEAGHARVLLTPAAILISASSGASSIRTTALSDPSRLNLISARLDDSLNYQEEQLFAGPAPSAIQVLSSNTAVGSVSATTLVLPLGVSSLLGAFQPAHEGETTLSVVPPPGLAKPAQFSEVKAIVGQPGLALSDEVRIGKDLQIAGILSLGAPAPKGGLVAHLTSSDPTRLVLSDSDTRLGSGSITIPIKPGEAMKRFYLQALGQTGSVQYQVEAPGFRGRTATVFLTPSGIVLTPAFQGPPDEAKIHPKGRIDGSDISQPVDLHRREKLDLIAWTAQLDPVTHRAADITVQPLRAGLTIKVPLTNSTPKVGRVESSVTISGGSEHSVASFAPLNPGSTTVSVQTPEGFTAAANSLSVVAVVKP